MHVLAAILQNNNITQFNIFDKANNESHPKVPAFDVEEKISFKRSPAQISVRDVVFSILSKEAKNEAIKRISKFPDAVERQSYNQDMGVSGALQEEEKKQFNSLTFLMNSGFTEEHFQRLFVKASLIKEIPRNSVYIFCGWWESKCIYAF